MPALKTLGAQLKLTCNKMIQTFNRTTDKLFCNKVTILQFFFNLIFI